MVFSSLFIDLLGLVVALVVIFITYYKSKFQYWRRNNFPYLEPSIPFGNLSNPLSRKIHVGIELQNIYNEAKRRGWKHVGVYSRTTPFYMPIHLDYVKNILTKDFQYFVDRIFFVNEKDDPLSAHLFNLGGSRWRNLRTKLTPTFTSGRMKMMFPTLVECESSLRDLMEKQVSKGEPIDIKEVLACFTTDIIGSCAFGLDFKSIKDENSPFRVYGRKIFHFDKKRVLKRVFAAAFPKIARAAGVRLLPEDVSDFFLKVVEDTVEYREKNNIFRDDFIQLLIQLKNNSKNEGTGLTMEELAAQCFVFFIAGFETSSTTMTFALYELAKNPDIQERVRNEIVTVLKKHENKITYEAIQEMKYLSQVLDETLRKYPSGGILLRRCVQDYKIPDDDLIIKKGTNLFISVLAIHYDEEYYPEPEKFDPDRFLEENKSSRDHYAYIPFGEGPRICIGLRFGLMQSKVGLTSLLKNYKFVVNQKTKEPLVMSPKSPVMNPKGKIWLNAEKI